MTNLKEARLKRKPHAVMNLQSRQLKAMKIQRILQLHGTDKKLKILEVGTGSGGIAHYFGTDRDLTCDVVSVDIIDNRKIKEGYQFVKVGGVYLPFKDNSFDVVITNHVIEHVGTENAQHEHLSELRRVLAPNGIGYLAVPNRWMIVEPHYKLPFLSWLPVRHRSSFLKMFREQSFYDCEPLEMWKIEQFLDQAGFKYVNVSIEAAEILYKIENTRYLGLKVYQSFPYSIKRWLRPLMPTLIYRIKKQLN